MQKHRCERYGREYCIDKKRIPRKFLLSYSHVHDCPVYYGPKPVDYTGDGKRREVRRLLEKGGLLNELQITGS